MAWSSKNPFIKFLAAKRVIPPKPRHDPIEDAQRYEYSIGSGIITAPGPIPDTREFFGYKNVRVVQSD